MAAVIVHAGASALLAFAPPRAKVARIEAVIAPVEIALEDDEESAPVPSQAPPSPPAEIVENPGARLPAPAGVRAGAATAAKDPLAMVTPPTAGTGSPIDAPTTDDGSTWTYRPTTRAFDATSRHLLAPGGARAAVGPNDAPPKPPGVSKTGGVTEALDEHDVKLGISRGGEVLSAMEGAARAGNGPLRGNATFEIIVDAKGQASVSLQNASDDHDGWAGLVASMRDAVSKRHVRIAPGSKGHRIVVRIESRIQYADGRDPRADGPRVDARGLKITETKTQITLQLPSVTAGVVGKTCAAGVHVGLDGVSIIGGCSPENAGIPPQRVVSGRIVSEARL